MSEAPGTNNNSAIIENATLAYVVLGSLSFVVFGIMAILHPQSILSISKKTLGMNDAGKTFANLFGARNIPVGIFPLFMLALRERKMLAYCSFLLGIFQAFDLVFSITGKSAVTIVVPFLMAVLFFASGMYLLRSDWPKK